MDYEKQWSGMSKLLIAISSCQSYEDAGLNQPLRDTWLSDAVKQGIDYKFFHGSGSRYKEDVVIVNRNDQYYDLTSKTKEKLHWAMLQGYDYVFACFPDTYACPERLLSCGFENHDYMGTHVPPSRRQHILPRRMRILSKQESSRVCNK